MSTALTPSKRPDDSDIAVQNGKEKKQRVESLNSPNETSKSSPHGILLRMLCPISKVESLFGVGDAFSLQIHQETGALVKVEESIPGCDERVVTTIYPDEEKKMNTEQAKEDQNNESNKVVGSDDKDESSEGDKDKKSVPAEELKSRRTPLVQRAMLLIFERMVEAEPEPEPEPEGKPDAGPETDGDDQRKKKSATCIMRLLVLSSQVGSLLGKSGSVIKQMSNESGAQIRILPRDKLPTCASAGDDLVQITGEVEEVRKALLLVSEQLLENKLGSNESNPVNISGCSSNSSNHPPPRQDHPSSHRSHTARGTPRDFHEGEIPGRMKPFPEITFRLLCNNDMVGCVIGKGGTIIKTLEQESGCEIKVLEATSESEERIIVISGPVHPNDRISAPQDGVVRVQTRIFRAYPEDKEKPLVARLLVSSNQIGCLLGKGGSVIAEMRKSSGAYIRILGKEQVPKCASENEEVVQVNGDYEVVKEALLQITSRLIHHFFKDMFPSTDYPPHPSFMEPGPPFPPRMGRREFSPPFHSLRNFDGMAHMGGPPPHGGFYPHDERPPYFHNMQRPGMPHSLTDRNTWGRQGFMEAGVQMGLPDFAAPHGRMGFNGVRNQPIITSTTIEVIVPQSVVPEIYGEDGSHLKQIIEFSDAKIKINDPKPGAKETAITITGTPEQSNAAQSLIQAFVMLEKESKS